MREQEWYTLSTTKTLLKTSERVLRVWVERGYAATNGRSHKARRYAKDWVDGLARLLSLYPPMRFTDEALLELYGLQREFNNLPPVARERHSARVRSLAERLADSGQVWRLEKLAAELGFSLSRLQKWSLVGKLSALRVGRNYYVSAVYGRYIVDVYSHWLTAEEAATKLGIWASSALERIARGKLPAVKCADGRYRIDPEVLKPFIVDLPDEPVVSVDEAVRRIGCVRRTLDYQIEHGRVATVGRHGKRQISEREVVRWQAWFSTLNGFEWLQPQVTLTNRYKETFSLKQVAGKLKLGTATVGRWARLDLLPFLPASFSDEHKLERLFVKRYIEGLQRYARGEPLTLELAAEYKSLCEKNRRIV